VDAGNVVILVAPDGKDIYGPPTAHRPVEDGIAATADTDINSPITTAATKPTFRFGTKTGDKICRNQGFLIANLCQGKTSHWIRHMFFVSMPRIITLCAILGKHEIHR